MKKKERPTDGGGNWMDTYGDLVTLLLTFFVMLYSMSNLNEQKWEVFVRSLFPASSETVENVAINEPVGEGADPVTGSVKIDGEVPEPMDMDTIYLTLAQKMNELGIDGVTISRGEDYTFIVFQDKTFFDGDSSYLTEQGKETLEVFCDAIAPAKDTLSQINIMGHTAQGDPDRPNTPRTDRMLSAMRGAEVCIFIQEKNIIEPEKLVTTSYGQFRPVDTSETREGRARNRRVELLMIDEGADVRSLNEYYEEYNTGVNAGRTVVTDGKPMDDGHGFAPAQPSAEGVSTDVSPVMNHVEETAASPPVTQEPAAGDVPSGIGTEGDIAANDVTDVPSDASAQGTEAAGMSE